MVFSNSCNPGPSSLKDLSNPTIKLSSKLENALLKNGLLSPTAADIITDQSPIRKEFYSVINQSYSTQQELNSTKEKLNISLKTQNEQEKELIEVKEKVTKLQLKLASKINEIKESQNEANKYLKNLKLKEDENNALKVLILDLKDSFGKLKDEVSTVKQDTISGLNDLNEIVKNLEDEIKLKRLELTENNNEQCHCNIEFETVIDKDLDQVEEDSESLHNSSTISEHSQISASDDYSYYKPEHYFQSQQNVTLSRFSGNATSQDVSPKKSIPTWILIISAIIIFLSLWIKINGSLFGQQPHFQLYYTSMPPS